MADLLLILFLLLSVLILKCGFEMYKYLINKGLTKTSGSFQEQLAFIPRYINATKEETGQPGKWFKILTLCLVLQVIIFFTLIFVLQN